MEEIRMNEIELGNSVSGRVAALHSQEVFYAMLRHERARANRDGSEFSLAVFNLSDTRAKSQKMKHIVGRIRHKMRSIDEIGLLDGQNIGVLLPATNLKGGRNLQPAYPSPSVPLRVPFLQRSTHIPPIGSREETAVQNPIVLLPLLCSTALSASRCLPGSEAWTSLAHLG